jgi:uncharacterized protein (DUF2062 family)
MMNRAREIAARWLAGGAGWRRVVWALVLGAAAGVFPVLGLSTLLCAALAAGFRLNMPLAQSANWAMGPLPLLLWIPFLRLGERLLGAAPLPLSAQALRDLVADRGLYFAADLAGSMLHALLGWLAVCAVAAAVVALGTGAWARVAPAFARVRD